MHSLDTSPFDPKAYGPVLEEFLAVDRVRELGPGQPVESARATLAGLTIETAFKHTGLVDTGRADREMARLCLAGLWLAHDFLEESHEISQQVQSGSGSYWHGIMHRREPDYSNAKYWFRRTGDHPVFAPLAADAARLAARSVEGDAGAWLRRGDAWSADRFVDFCAAAAEKKGPAEEIARDVAAREWELLFDFCFREAIAG